MNKILSTRVFYLEKFLLDNDPAFDFLNDLYLYPQRLNQFLYQGVEFNPFPNTTNTQSVHNIRDFQIKINADKWMS